MVLGIAAAAIAAAAVVLVGLWVVGVYNKLVRRRAQVTVTGAQIDVQLGRRHDLLPRLVAAVAGYAAHERQTFEAVVHARNVAMGAVGGPRAAQSASEQALTGGVDRLLAVAERYPELQASGTFASLQAELANTENGIAYARQFYNGAVETLNATVTAVPDRFVAALVGIGTAEYFEAGGEARSATAAR